MFVHTGRVAVFYSGVSQVMSRRLSGALSAFTSNVTTPADGRPALHVCRTCHKSNPNKGALTMHLKNDPMDKKAPTKESPHQCDTCSCTFRDQLRSPLTSLALTVT